MHFICKIFTIPSFKFPFKRVLLKKFIVFVVFLVLLYSLYYVYQLVITTYFVTFHCSFKDVQEAITSICDSYYSNLSFGNICSGLCITGKLRPVKCINHHSGKEIVFEAKWGDVDVVFKASRKNISYYEQIYWTEPNTLKKVYPELSVFGEMLINSVEKTLKINLNQKEKHFPFLIDKLWSQNFKEFSKLSNNLNQHNAMDNIFYLIQQPEYLFSKIYENKKVFPRILGSCGHAFIAEHYKPLDNYFSVFYPSWRFSFNQRLKWAIKILDFLEKIETSFDKPLHLCDVKMGHFGFNWKGEVRFIDLDMVYSEEALKENLQANSCHEDCSFIHCRGSCNQSTGFCSQDILNNNLQRVCGNIFHGYTWKMTTGLLGNAPYEFSEDLKDILTSCLNQNISTPTLNKIFSSKLKNILKTMLITNSEELKA